MKLAFTNTADFGRMADVPLTISEVKHKAFINVHNGGLEAAAATAIGITKDSFPPQSDPKVSLFMFSELLGMKIAFTTAADFGRMAEAPLTISNIKHKAYINVHNKGLEAAAATAVGMTLTSMPLPSVPKVSILTIVKMYLIFC